jgi:hypothetical protein
MPVVMKANRKIAGQVCPICHTAFSLGEEIRNCEQCRVPHHVECWQENRGCSTYACANAPAKKDQLGATDIQLTKFSSTASPSSQSAESASPGSEISEHVRQVKSGLSGGKAGAEQFPPPVVGEGPVGPLKSGKWDSSPNRVHGGRASLLWAACLQIVLVLSPFVLAGLLLCSNSPLGIFGGILLVLLIALAALLIATTAFVRLWLSIDSGFLLIFCGFLLALYIAGLAFKHFFRW